MSSRNQRELVYDPNNPPPELLELASDAILDGSISISEAMDFLQEAPAPRARQSAPVRVNEAVIGTVVSQNVQMHNEQNNDDFDTENFDSDEEETDFSEIAEIIPSLSEKELFFGIIGRYIFSNYSERKVQKEIQMDGLMGRSLIKVSEYDKFIADVANRYGLIHQFVCPGCFNLLPKSKKCSCEMSLRRGKESTLILVSTAHIRPQLENIIRSNYTELSEMTLSSNKRTELSDFPRGRPLIVNGVRVLRICINTDGVRPKQSYRADLWPVYLSLADLTTKSRGSVINSILSALICGIKNPTDEVWTVAISPLKNEIDDIKARPIEIHGTKFAVQIDHGIFDNEAAVSIYAGIGYNAIGAGCLNCYAQSERSQTIRGTGKQAQSRIWPITGEVAYRTAESIMLDAGRAQHGLKRVTPWMSIVMPTNWRLDALHVLEEGILKRLIDPFFPSKSWRDMNTVYFKEGAFPSRSKLFPRSLLEYNSFNGGDRRCLFFTFFPFVLQYEIDEQQLKSIILMLFWHLIRLLACSWLNEGLINDIVTVLPVIAKYIQKIYGDSLSQMKSHRFFMHLREEILQYGTPYDFSSASFEMLNRTIKVNVHPYDTTSLPEHALQSMLVRQDWISQVNDMNNKSEHFKKLINLICPSFNFRSSVYDIANQNNFSDNSLIHFRHLNILKFGKILKRNNDIFTVGIFIGKSLLSCVNEDESINGDIKNAFRLFEKHPQFGIRVLKYGDTVHISAKDIMSHCCKFSDQQHDYLFSLDFRCPGK